jgi:protocatechuate 3,4-dioxygenase beta subunit
VSAAGIGWTPLRVARKRELIESITLLVEVTSEVAVRVEDDQGRPVAGAGVCAWPRYAPFWRPDPPDRHETAWLIPGPPELVGLFAAITDSTGHANLPRLPRPPRHLQDGETAGTPYALVAGARGFALTEPQRILAGASHDRHDRVTLKLRALASFTLSGTVRTPAGSPVAGASIEAVDEVARSDAAGNFTVSGPSSADGFVHVEAYAPGYGLVRRRLSVPLAEPRLDLVLEPLAPIAGRVTDDAGLPVPEATVGGLSRKDRHVSPDRRSLGEDGGFVFSEATAGEWTLHVVAPPGFEIPGPDRRVRGGDRDVRVVLRRTPRGNARLVAELTDPMTGEPLDAITARVAMTSGGASVKTSRPPGRVLADGLPPGSWRITVDVADARRIEHAFTVRPDDLEVRLRLSPRRPGVLTGRILFDDLAGVRLPARVSLRLLPDDAGMWCTAPGVPAAGIARGAAKVDPAGDGRFRFEDVRTGQPIRVQLWGDALLAGEADVTVPEGRTAHVELRAQLGGEVVFTLPATSPYRWAELTVRRSDGSWTDPARSRPMSHAPTKLRLPAGEHLWRARLHPSNEERERKPPRTLEGTVVVVAGGSVEVALE